MPDQLPIAVKWAGILLIDLGSKKRRDVKRLGNGRGKLMDRVTTVVDDMRYNGEIGGDSEVVVVVVKEKRKKRGRFAKSSTVSRHASCAGSG